MADRRGRGGVGVVVGGWKSWRGAVVVVGWKRGGERGGGGGGEGGAAGVREGWLADLVARWAFGGDGGAGGAGRLSSSGPSGDSDRRRVRPIPLLVTIAARFSASVMVASFDFALDG
jgi:hypothetical protein